MYIVCVYADVSYRWQHRLTFHVYIISLILLNLFYGVALFCIKSNFEFRCSSALLTPLANLNAVNLMLLSQLFMYIVCYGATRINCRDDFKHNCNMCFSCCKQTIIIIAVFKVDRGFPLNGHTDYTLNGKSRVAFIHSITRHLCLILSLMRRWLD